MVTINNKITLNAHVCMQFLAFILQTYLSHDILLYFYRMKRFLAFSMYMAGIFTIFQLLP